MAAKGIRKPDKALTARFVETAVKPGKYFDGHGLFLLVRPNGARQWVQRIMVRRRRVELGLGSPPAVSLATARKLALDNRGKAMLGGDPLQERREARAGLTFDAAVEKYLASKLDGFKNAKHKLQWRSTLETYARPVLGAKLVRDISTQDVLRVLEPIWADKTETATRVRGRIEAVLSWATVAGHRSGDNPARWKGNLSELLTKPGAVAVADNQPALALADAARWWRDLRGREGIATAALQFLALTAARSGEVRGATWGEFTLPDGDAAGGLWVIPGKRMKMKREHRVPLTPEAVAILRAVPRIAGSTFVFPAVRGGQLSDMALSATMRRIHAADVKAGGPGYLDPSSKRAAVPHGLRSTFRQWTAERGYARDMAEIALAHLVGNEVERAYMRSDMLERRRGMMQSWASFLEGREHGENVVLLEAAR
jgi:integrase